MLPDAVPEPIQRRLADYASLLRIDRPIGTLLLLWPTYWALWLAGALSPVAQTRSAPPEIPSFTENLGRMFMGSRLMEMQKRLFKDSKTREEK